jgi:translation elongation factor EF-1beta
MEAALLADASSVMKFPDHREDERDYVKYLMGTLGKDCHGSGSSHPQASHPAHTSSLVQEIEKARQQLKSSLNAVAPAHHGKGSHNPADIARIKHLEDGMHHLTQRVCALEELLRKLTVHSTSPAAVTAEHNKQHISTKDAPVKSAPVKAPAGGDDDDFDMFGSDEEDPEAEKERKERLAKYAQSKAGKAPLIAKSNIILDVKPWDDETDMKEMERLVRTVQCEGLLWGQAQLVPLAYGINKLQISCVVEDDKVGTDFLEEEITKFEDLVQSVDVAAFNKI